MDELPFLRLLADEAPVEAFEASLAAAREAGAAETELQAAREAMEVALQVRETLQERRRREAELSALNETAQDLTSMRDVDQVLQAIVRRARRLLGTDVSYLTLIDTDRGDTYMRVTDGAMHRAFQQVRLPEGVGLGGLVAQTRSPYASSNYFTDARFHHTGTIDDAVAGEGLVAILGVPILLGDVVIGVLFAANRHERPFSAGEITLLSSLASHAAVAIENARLFQETRQAIDDLNAANVIIRRHSEAVELAAASHERLTQLVLHGGDVDDVAGAVAELFSSSLCVLDPDRRVLAAAGDAEVVVDDAVRAAFREARASGRSVPVANGAGAASGSGRGVPVMPDGDAARAWVTPIMAGAEVLGALVLAGRGDVDSVDIRTLERAAQVTALLLLTRRSIAEAEQRVRGELLTDLIADPHRDPEGMRRRARRLAADLDRPHAVVVVRPEGSRSPRALTAASALATELGGLAGLHDGDLVLLLPSDDADGEVRGAVQRLGAQLDTHVTAGVAGPAVGIPDIAEAHGDARRCLRLLLALGRVGDVASARDLGPYALVFANASADEISGLVERSVGPVLAYDDDRGTRLASTLAAYLDDGRNVTRTAKRLHIHVNTLYQRLERIGQLLGDGWQDADVLLEVHLALRLHHLAGAAGAGAPERTTP